MTSEKRRLRVGEEIQKILGKLFTTRLRDDLPALVGVPEVRVTPDLLLARVFISVVGDEVVSQETLQWLKHHNTEIRRHLAGELRVKQVPQLRFLLDTSLDNAAHLEDLFARINRERSAENKENGAGDSAPGADS
jgi:ribosome-binding factor A